MTGEHALGRVTHDLVSACGSHYLTIDLPPNTIMGDDPKITTTLSTKGQVIVPKAIRRKKRWRPGTKFTVEETAAGILLKPASPFPLTKPEDVFGMLDFKGPPKTIEQMDQAIMEEVRRRHARGRY